MRFSRFCAVHLNPYVMMREDKDEVSPDSELSQLKHFGVYLGRVISWGTFKELWEVDTFIKNTANVCKRLDGVADNPCQVAGFEVAAGLREENTGHDIYSVVVGMIENFFPEQAPWMSHAASVISVVMRRGWWQRC